MPSRLTLNPQSNATTSPAGVQQLAARARANKMPEVADALENLESRLARLERAIANAPTLKSLTVDSADIANLTVGGQRGPGQMQVLSGPPDYTPVGWDGTGESADPVDIVSFNADTVTTDGPHGAEPGHVVHIQGTSQPYRNGYFAVLTTPTDDTYTVADPGTANATGGTSTVQFGGGWRRQFAFGGDDFLTAPVFTSPQGEVYIGERGSILILDGLGAVKGFIGVVKDAPIACTASDNGSGKMRLTAVAPHGYAEKDDVVFTPASGGPVDAMVTAVINANTVDTDAAATAGVGEMYRYRGPFYGQSVQLGKPTGSEYPFRTFSDGGLRIGITGGTLEYDPATGTLTLRNAHLSVISGDGNNEVLITPSDGVKVIYYATTPDTFVQIKDGALGATDGVARAVVSPTGRLLQWIVGGAAISEGVTSSESVTIWLDGFGTQVARVEGRTGADGGYADFPSLRIGGIQIIDSAGNAAFSNYYTKSEIDATVATIGAILNTKADHGTYAVVGASVTI